MKKIMDKFLKNGRGRGLLLIDLPPGAGKSTAVLELICKHILEDHGGRTLVFITNRLSNLPGGPLWNQFQKRGAEALFQEKFLRLEANATALLKGWTEDLEALIPREVKIWQEYKELKNHIAGVQHMDKSNEGSTNRNLLQEKLRQESEPAFRKRLAKTLREKYPTVAARLEAIKTDKAWQWVGSLYPGAFLGEKQIIFLSMDKFLLPVDTLVEPPYLLHNSELLKDAVIFIDEIDDCKETILKNIINNSLRYKIDYLELFKDIYKSLNTYTFPSSLTQAVKAGGRKRAASLGQILAKFKEIAEDIYRDYTLNYSHKTKDLNQDRKGLVFFQDTLATTLINGQEKFTILRPNQKKRHNYIEYARKRPEEPEADLQIMLGRIHGFINYFCNGVGLLADNYRRSKIELKLSNWADFTREEAISSVLRQFTSNPAWRQYLLEQILSSPLQGKTGRLAASFDLSFYQRGFRYYGFADGNDHDFQSDIMLSSFPTTPEQFLLRLCEKAQVIGLSATGTLPGNIGNFALDYLEGKLGQNFYKLDEEERRRLERWFTKVQGGYQGVEIQVKFLGSAGYSPKDWVELYEDQDLGQAMFQQVADKLEQDSDGFHKRRLLRIALAFKEFIIHEDMRSFLCLLTKHPREHDSHLDRGILEDIFQKLCTRFDVEKPVGELVAYLAAEGYDRAKEELLASLGRGERRFVISTYKTIGRGQNLQYPIPADLQDQLVYLNRDWSKGEEKDFDGIYLEKPTHMLEMLKEGMTEADLAKYTFQLEYLQEGGELSRRAALARIKQGFGCYAAGKPRPKVSGDSDPYQCPSVKLAATGVVIQALGRLCRTYVKSPRIYLYGDCNIPSAVDATVLQGRIFNYEVIKFLQAATRACEPALPTPALRQGALVSARVNGFLNRLLRQPWTEESMAQWQKLRDFVLRHPTLGEEGLGQEEGALGANFYVALPEPGTVLYYGEKDDYREVSLSLSPHKDYPGQVSAEGARLPRLCRLGLIREGLAAQGYATAFAPNKLIMAPPLFNNIYKGALGESVGCLLFQAYARVELEGIREPEHFEKFDFKVPHSEIYVDFKHWRASAKAEQDKVAEVYAKARDCGAQCVIVANILSPFDKVGEEERDGIKLLWLPALLRDEDLSPNQKAWDAIRRCLDEYAVADQ